MAGIIEIQAIENVGLSLNTINSNFINLQDKINGVKAFIDTTTTYGSGELGYLKIVVGSGADTDIGLVLENSGSIAGNLTIAKNLTVNTDTLLKGVTTLQKSTTFEKTVNDTPVATMEHRLTISSDILIPSIGLSDAQIEASTTRIDVKSDNTNKGKSVVTVDLDSLDATHIYVKLNEGLNGQIVTVRFSGTNTNSIEKVNFHNEYFLSTYDISGLTNTAIEIDASDASATAQDIEKATVTLYCDENLKWNVLNNSHSEHVKINF